MRDVPGKRDQEKLLTVKTLQIAKIAKNSIGFRKNSYPLGVVVPGVLQVLLESRQRSNGIVRQGPQGERALCPARIRTVELVYANSVRDGAGHCFEDVYKRQGLALSSTAGGLEGSFLA